MGKFQSLEEGLVKTSVCLDFADNVEEDEENGQAEVPKTH
jgi:hypothetical protein